MFKRIKNKVTNWSPTQIKTMAAQMPKEFPPRYIALACCGFLVLLSLFTIIGFGVGWLTMLIGLVLCAVGYYDLTQTKHAVLRNYPVIGHLRYMLEYIPPEMRQYFVESDKEAAPFSRAQRSLVYQRAKGESDKQPFGTQLDVKAPGFEWINHSMQPSVLATHDFRITIGGEQCQQPYSASIFNISALSFGALSANAILALNKGAQQVGHSHASREGRHLDARPQRGRNVEGQARGVEVAFAQRIGNAAV